MKANRLLLLMIIFSFCLTSCDPEDSIYEESTIQNTENCCGELGDIPSEPGDDDEEE